MLVDEVCWYFPELKFVFRHGCEPWADWPSSSCSSGRTSTTPPAPSPPATTPRRSSTTPTPAADKVLYAGYFPMGLSLERIMGELPDVPLKAEVWPRFLRENAIRVFDL